MMFRALLLLMLTLAGALRAETADVTLLPGWREAERHVAGLGIVLEPGWKTYWRAPGEAGIPPHLDWSGSSNVADLRVAWPVPHVFSQNGFRSIGYANGVVLPLIVTPRDASRPVDLRLTIDIGTCRDICVPVSARVAGVLPAASARPDPRIRAALAHRPMRADEAGAGPLGCRLDPARKGARITAEIAVPRIAHREDAVIELSDPHVWVGEPKVTRTGGRLRVEAKLVPPRGHPLSFDRSGLRLTILGGDRAVEILGCD